MHAISTITLLASLSMGILAQSPGTFDTFTDPVCAEGGQGVTVMDRDSSGVLGEDVVSVKSNLQDCGLILWENGAPRFIRPGDSECVPISEPESPWEVVCP